MHVGQKESSPPIAASTGKPGKGTGPDYGWLKRLLWARINRIKQYSDEALHHEWEGRVVIVVTVRSDGRIDEVTVAESSGNRSLDREAAALVARASPLDLDRALGAARVKFRVPISFGLE
jgi:protein TonB